MEAEKQYIDLRAIRDHLPNVISNVSPRSQMSALMGLRAHRADIDGKTVFAILQEFYRQLNSSFVAISKKLELQMGKPGAPSARSAHSARNNWPTTCSALMQAISNASDDAFLNVEQQNIIRIIDCLDSIKVAARSFHDLHEKDTGMRMKMVIVKQSLQNLGVLRSLLMRRYREIM